MFRKKSLFAGLILALAASLTTLHAQDAAKTAKIHGHAQDPLGVNLANAKVQVTTDGKAVKYTFPTDANGNFTGDGIAPGTYIILLIQTDPTTKADKSIDYQKDVKFAAGEDVTVNFDLSRQEYIDKMTPEQKKLYEETKAKNAEVNKENSSIKNVNNLINQAREARNAKDFAKAVDLDTQATQALPGQALVWAELGVSELGAGKNDDSVTHLKKALELYAADTKKQKPAEQGNTLNELAEAQAKSGKTDDAIASYEQAAKIDPTGTGLYYSNEAVVLYKLNKMEEAGTAADKAIAADPKRPLPYYIKGQALVQKASVDPKTNKITLPPGCAEAYNQFLDLAPTGPLADEVRSILQSMGQTIHSTYKAGKKNN